MLSPALSLLAVQGDVGIDMFRRIEDAEQGRLRYLCVATRGESGLALHEAAQAGTEEEREAALDLLARTPALTTPFALADTRSHPDFADPALRFVLLLYQDFFRARAVASMAAAMFAKRLLQQADALLADPGSVVAAVRGIYDFNLLSPTQPLRQDLVALLSARALPESAAEPLAYALRMLGDLSMRAGEKALAMDAHDGAVRLADNPHRRRRAIEAALAAGALARAARHLSDFRGKWPLPPDLAAHAAELIPENGQAAP